MSDQDEFADIARQHSADCTGWVANGFDHRLCNCKPRTLSADEFEYLALMGRTQAGDLIVGEGGAERVLQYAKQLALAPDDVLDVYVPGRLRCPKCKFVLTVATLFLQSGEIGASKEEVYQQSEPCPNDREPMVRVTWREEADANRQYAERLITEIIEAVGAQSLPEAMEAIKIAREEALFTSRGESATTLKDGWERFAEERSGMAATTPLAFARQAFYAGAQVFCSSMNAVIAGDAEDNEAAVQVEALYRELEAAVEEMKL